VDDGWLGVVKPIHAKGDVSGHAHSPEEGRMVLSPQSHHEHAHTLSAQPTTAQPSPAQPSPAQPSPAQPSPAQPSLSFPTKVLWRPYTKRLRGFSWS